MIRHLLKLVWNRKRANALIIAEIIASFLVVFAVLAALLTVVPSWNEPLGFDVSDVWDVAMNFDIDGRSQVDPKLRDSVRRMVAEVSSLDGVESVAGSNTPPYSMSAFEGSWTIDGKEVELSFDDVTDGFASTVRVDVVKGRWFTPEDDASDYQPVVLDVNAARALYGSKDPIGQKFDEVEKQVMRVVGVVKTYRKEGEMAGPANMVFRRVSLTRDVGRLGSHLLIRTRPGSPPALEREIAERLHRVAPDVTFRLRRIESIRRTALRLRTAPIVLGGIIALFLISMVMLGLTGVLWQSVTRRSREIGLRRAMGATGGAVHRQVLGEVALLTTVAVLVGSVLVAQLPILGVFSVVPPAAFTGAFLLSLAAIYGLTLLCGVYPSWLASRLEPADALRYE